MTEPLELLRCIHGADNQRLQPIFERHGVSFEESELETLSHEICLDGANTFASTFRAFKGEGWARKGVSWEEIIRDVGGKLKVELPPKASVPNLEQRVLAAVVERYFDSLSDEERAEIDGQLSQVAGSLTVKDTIAMLSKGGFAALGVSAVVRAAAVEAVKKVLTQVLTRLAVKEAGKQATKIAGAVVPGLNILLGAWTVIDLAGPAYRKTIPTVIELALIRLELESDHE
jgi:uncharacterized protein YaaW (UPF0174 family)